MHLTHHCASYDCKQNSGKWCETPKYLLVLCWTRHQGITNPKLGLKHCILSHNFKWKRRQINQFIWQFAESVLQQLTCLYGSHESFRSAANRHYEAGPDFSSLCRWQALLNGCRLAANSDVSESLVIDAFNTCQHTPFYKIMMLLPFIWCSCCPQECLSVKYATTGQVYRDCLSLMLFLF